jgi:anthraniloyl-CoA monooxygenase
MRIVCIGGGPAGLYFALLMKKAVPASNITVIERNRPDDTFGWGVVFSDQTLTNLASADRKTHDQILDSFNHWDDIDIHFKGRTITSGGHGFSGIGRQRLLNILQERCAELGVELRFETELLDESPYTDADLIIASDGANSRIRTKYTEFFEPHIETRKCKYVWLGTHKLFDAFTFAFEETPWGWFQAHAYRFDDSMSTFIVETPEENWLRAGLGEISADESIRFCEQLFAPYLDGHALISNASHLKSPWINFRAITNEHWSYKNIVLMGDAAHTAHFSIGSGTKLALEDAIALAKAFQRTGDLQCAIQQYEAERKIEVLKLQNAARNSTEWFEHGMV